MRINFNVDYNIDYNKNLIIINSVEMDRDLKEAALSRSLDFIRKELDKDLDRDPIEAMSLKSIPSYRKGVLIINTLIDFENDETNKPYQVIHTHNIDWEE